MRDEKMTSGGAGVSRRRFLQIGLGGLAASAAGAGAAGRPDGKGKPRLGVQLGSVDGLCIKNFPAALRAIKKIGYEGVEFTWHYRKPPKELRKMLDDAGLVACGTHFQLGKILPANIGRTMEFAAELGSRYLIVPAMGPGRRFRGPAGGWWKKTARDFTAAAETAGKNGMCVGYHSHKQDFEIKCADAGGRCRWEVFWANTGPDVSMQMDVGHVAAAGEDPVYWLERFPNPCRTVHAKETYPGPGILGRPGEGKKGVDWDAFFPAVEKKGLEWYIVECEGNPNTLEKIAESYRFMASKGKA